MTASTRDSQFDVYAASVVKSLTNVVKAKPDMRDSHVNDFSVSTRVCMRVYVCACMCMHVYVCVRVHACMRVCVSVCVCMCACLCMGVYHSQKAC